MIMHSKRNKLLAENVIKQMKNRFIDAYYCKTGNDACKKALELINEGSTIAYGGSMTIKSIGLIEELKNGDYHVIDKDTCDDGQDVQRLAFTADYYLMSSNAISDDGQLVNIDGNGNRCAALVFGPKNVIIIASMNKVVHGLDEALSRARTVAAPINVQRFPGKVTGCSQTGMCQDCKTPDCICCNTVITRMSRPEGKIKVILVDEELGF